MRLGALVVLCCAFSAHAFPIAGKPLRIVVAFPPGGQTDIQARASAQKRADAKDLHERWGAVIRTLGVTLDQ